MASNRFRPGLSLGDYYPSAARNIFTQAEARKEYARLRKIANRRLEALERNYHKSEMARMFRGGFQAAAKDEGDRIYARLFAVARYMSTQLGSVSGQRAYRKAMIKSLHESGYTFVNNKNFDDFTIFLEEVKQHMSEREFRQRSEEIVDFFEDIKEEGADPETVGRSFEVYYNKERPLAAARKGKPTPSSYEKAARRQNTGRRHLQPLGSPKQRKRGRR